MLGTVFDIQRFSVHDGPGIRTTVFMKGCSLRCAWCHNPEGLSAETQLKYDGSLCIHCGRCSSPPVLNDAVVCPSGALTTVGRKISTEQLTAELVKDRVFYGESGGVTFSGGECLLQAEFITSVMKELKRENISVAVDTAGFVPFENFEITFGFCDIFLYDVKIADPVLHRKYTGHDNALIISNLEKLCRTDKKIFIRIPVIPDVNESEKEMSAISDLLCRCLKVSGRTAFDQITLIPYHTLGKSKYQSLGMTCSYTTAKTVTPERLRALYGIFGQMAISEKH